MKLEDIAWSKRQFEMLKDQGVWGVPRSGLMFQRRGEELWLLCRMPWVDEMPCTAAQLQEQQDGEYQSIKRHMEAAGITVKEQ